jgi:hypothetical protein
MISQDGRPCISLLSTHSVRDLPEVTRWTRDLPEVIPAPELDAGSLPPAEYIKSKTAWLEMPDGVPPFFKRMKIAPRYGAAPMAGIPVDPNIGTQNGGWVALPDPRPVDPELLIFLVDAFWPSVIETLKEPVAMPTLDLTIHLRTVLPPEGLPYQPLLVHNVSTAVIDGCGDSDSRVYSSDGALLAQGRQLQLVAPLNI